MTVEIIKPGVLPKDRPFTATCRSCGCEFRFTESDAAYFRDQRDGDFLTIPCPTCALSVTVSARNRA